MMARVPERRFHLLDGMVLIVATGLGLARVGPLFHLAMSPEASISGPGFSEAIVRVWAWSLLCVPCLATWSIALVLLGLRRPRPWVKLLARQPGWLACLGASLILIVTGAWVMAQFVLNAPYAGNWEMNLYAFVQIPVAPMGGAVAGSWLTLALSGRWRPQTSWIDRAGRVLGTLWILLAPLYTRII
jgi:hypothetical protein